MSVTRTDNRLDNAGLETLWGLIKSSFVAKDGNKVLSDENYTTDEKTKLAGIAAGAEVNVQSNWEETDTSSDAYIKNKPDALKNPNSLTIGGKIYDGSSAQSVSLDDLGVYSKSEVDDMVKGNAYEVVSSLPTTGVKGKIYLVPLSPGETNDYYDEYIWVDARGSVSAHFEKIGNTKIDLSNYVQKDKNGSTTKPIYISNGKTAECSAYAGGTKVTLNGTDKGANTASMYAPTAAGTTGQYLESNGSGAPSWKSLDTTPTANSTHAVTSGGVKTALDAKLNESRYGYITDEEIASICVL